MDKPHDLQQPTKDVKASEVQNNHIVHDNRKTLRLLKWQCMLALGIIIIGLIIKYIPGVNTFREPLKSEIAQNIEPRDIADFIKDVKEVGLEYWRTK